MCAFGTTSNDNCITSKLKYKELYRKKQLLLSHQVMSNGGSECTCLTIKPKVVGSKGQRLNWREWTEIFVTSMEILGYLRSLMKIADLFNILWQIYRVR